ncbi:MAG: hypothetical protein LQ340_003422 [Diploschistes diacapsis]|nr:MAG: hypothetical protein LQ340_003422 [Diploschistes diacapsis]
MLDRNGDLFLTWKKQKPLARVPARGSRSRCPPPRTTGVIVSSSEDDNDDEEQVGSPHLDISSVVNSDDVDVDNDADDNDNGEYDEGNKNPPTRQPAKSCFQAKGKELLRYTDDAGGVEYRKHREMMAHVASTLPRSWAVRTGRMGSAILKSYKELLEEAPKVVGD